MQGKLWGMRERFGAIIITRSLDCMTDTLGREKYNKSQCQLRVTNLRRRVHGKVLKIQFYSNLSSESHGGGGGAGGNKTESLTGPSGKGGLRRHSGFGCPQASWRPQVESGPVLQKRFFVC